MKRVAITGIGAVTPLGLDAAVDLARSARRRERHRLDHDVRHGRPAGARRRRGEGLRPDPGRLGEGGAQARAQRAARRRSRPRGARRRRAERLRPARASASSSARRSAACPGILEQADILRERGPDRVSPNFLPNVLVDSVSGQLAISLGIKGPNYAVVSACATGSHAVGEAAEMIKRGAADAVLAGRHRGVHRAADPRRLHRDARARRRGRRPAARLAPVRRDARRLRDVRGRGRAAARGLGTGRAPRRRRSTPRCSATARRTTRITWRSPSRRRRASRR